MGNTQKPKKHTERTRNLSDRVTTPSLDLYTKYKEDKAVQFTSLFVRTYASTEEVERLLEVLNPDEYAYIVHDKDVTKTGEKKEPHIHLLVYKKSQFRLTKFLNFTDQAVRIEIPRSKKYCYEYLTHKNDPDKTAYSADEIHEYHKDKNTFAVTLQEARENRNLELLDDIGNLTRRQMAEKYGSDYIKNYQRYESFMEIVREEEQRAEGDRLARELNEKHTLSDKVDLKLDDALVALTYREAIVQFLVDNVLSNGGEFPSYTEFCKGYYSLLRLWCDTSLRIDRIMGGDK